MEICGKVTARIPCHFEATVYPCKALTKRKFGYADLHRQTCNGWPNRFEVGASKSDASCKKAFQCRLELPPVPRNIVRLKEVITKCLKEGPTDLFF